MSLKGANPIYLFRGTPYVDDGIDLTPDGGHILLEMKSTANTNAIGSSTYHIYVIRRIKDNLLQELTRDITILDKPSFEATTLIVLQGNSFDQNQSHGFYYDTTGGTSRIETSSSTVNSSILGNYTLTKNVRIWTQYWKAGYSYSAATRAVSVIKKPLIVMNGVNIISIEQYSTYIDQGASVRNFNNTSEVLTNVLTTSNNVNMQIPNTYYVNYSTQYATTVRRTVIVTPFTRIPIITLVGTSSYTITTSSIFTEPGFTVDVIDSASVVITTALTKPSPTTYTSSSPSQYTISYNYTTSYGKSAALVQRTIMVVDLPKITLTGVTSLPFGVSNTDPGYSVDSLSTFVSATPINTLILGSQTITYIAKLTDYPDITNTASRTITIVDVTAPIITLLGSIPILLDDNIAINQTENDNKIVALNANGNIMALASNTNNKTLVYTYESGLWSPFGEEINKYGKSLSLNSDGKILAIGGLSNNAISSISVFKYYEGSWGDMGNFKYLGNCFSLSADGNIIAVGGNNVTKVYKYDLSLNNWDNKLGQDINGEASDDMSGYSVSLNAAGDILAIGAILNDGVNKNNCGSTRIYKYNSTKLLWENLGQDIDGELAGDESGFSVSLSLSGYNVAIGSILNDNNTVFDSGSTRIYAYDGNIWNPVGDDIDGEYAGEQSGHNVSLSANGNIVAISNKGSLISSASTRIYTFNGTKWIKLCKDIFSKWSDSPSISLSGDGSILGVGSNVYKLINDKYVDLNIGRYIEDRAVSNEGSSVNISSFPDINITMPGEYIINYSSTDAFGNVGYNTRKVTVLAIPSISFVKNYDYLATGDELILPVVDNNSTLSYSANPTFNKYIPGTYSFTFTATSNNICTYESTPVLSKNTLGDYTLLFSSKNNINNNKIKNVLNKIITVVDPPLLTLLGDNPYNLILGTEYDEPGWINPIGTKVIGTGKILYEIQGSYDIIYKVSFNIPTVDSYFKRIVNVKKVMSNAEKISKSNALANIAALEETELIIAQRLSLSMLILYNLAKDLALLSENKIKILNSVKSLFDENNTYSNNLNSLKSSLNNYITALQDELTKSINKSAIETKIANKILELKQLELKILDVSNDVNRYNIELNRNAAEKDLSVINFIPTYNLIKAEYDEVSLSLSENYVVINSIITNRNNFRLSSLNFQTCINNYYNTSISIVNLENFEALNLVITEYESKVSNIDISQLINYNQKVLAYKNAIIEYHKLINIAFLAEKDASYSQLILDVTETKINEINNIKNQIELAESEALNIYNTIKNNKDDELIELKNNTPILKNIYDEKLALLNSYVKYLETDLITIVFNNKIDHLNRLKDHFSAIINYLTNLRLLDLLEDDINIIELKNKFLEIKSLLDISYVDFISLNKFIEKEKALEISKADYLVFNTTPLLLTEVNTKLNEYNTLKSNITIAYNFLKDQIIQNASSIILADNISNLFKISKQASNDSLSILNLINKAEDEAKDHLKAAQYKLLISISQNLTESVVEDNEKINEATSYLSDITSIKFQLRDIGSTQIELEKEYLQEYTSLYEALKVENTQNLADITRLLDEAKINKINAENAFNEADIVLKFSTNTSNYLSSLKTLYDLIKQYKYKVSTQTSTPEDDANNIINLASVRTLKNTRAADVIFYTTPRLLEALNLKISDFDLLKSNITNKVNFIEENKDNPSTILKNEITNLYNLADNSVDEAKEILDSLSDAKTEADTYLKATKDKSNISIGYNLSDEIKAADVIKINEATNHLNIITGLQSQLANIYVEQEESKNSYFATYNVLYNSIIIPNSISIVSNTINEGYKYKNSLFSIRKYIINSITSTNETLIEDIDNLEAINSTINLLGSQLEAELLLEANLSSAIAITFLPALNESKAEFDTISQSNFELLTAQENLILSGEAINNSTLVITNSIIVANDLAAATAAAAAEAGAANDAAAAEAAALAAAAAADAAAQLIISSINTINSQAVDYYNEVITYWNTSQNDLQKATISLNIADSAYKSSIFNAREAGINASNSQIYSTVTYNISLEANTLVNAAPTPINISGNADILNLVTVASNSSIESYKASNTSSFLSSTIAKNAFENTNTSFINVEDSNNKLLVYKNSIDSDLLLLQESNDITYKITILDHIYNTLNLAKNESLISSIALNDANYAADIGVIANDNSKDFYIKARDYSINGYTAKKSATSIILRMGSNTPYNESQNYYASSVEQINIGRDTFTTISDYVPTNIYQIVWKMDLNFALNSVNIKPPYPFDSEEQIHKRGLLPNGFIYLLGTDSYTTEIEIVSSEDNYGGFLIYTNNYFNKTISSSSNTGSLEDRLADLARYLRVLGDSSIDLLNSSQASHISSITKKIVTATYTYTADSLKIGDGILKNTQGYSSVEQDLAISTFMSNLKANNFWYASDINNSSAIQNIVKVGLCNLFDKDNVLNDLLGSSASSNVFIDSEKIAIKMKNNNDDFYKKFFSEQQLREVLSSVSAKNSRINYSNNIKSFDFKSGDSLSAVLRIIDADTKDSNSDRWMITLLQY